MTMGNGLEDEGRRRLLTLSDGVYAIAMTLLALSIELPALPTQPSDATLASAIGAAAPTYVGYAVSFLVAGIFWVGHRRILRHIHRIDRGVLWWNLLLLMAVASLPFPSRLIGRYPARLPVVVLYAATVAAIGLLHAALWLHATRHRALLDPYVDEATLRYNTLRGLIVPAVFLVSIPLAWWSPLAAMVLWLAIFVPLWLLSRWHPGAET